MRHRKAGKQLSRNPSHRKALLRNMVTSLLKYKHIETTDAKAKSLRPVAEKMITLAKRGDLHARRQALAYIQDKAVTHRLFDELKDRYLDRQGGYVRIVKKGIRKGDGAPISIVQLLPSDEEKKSDKKKVQKLKESKPVDAKQKEEVAVKKEKKRPEIEQKETSPDTAGDIAAEKKEKDDITQKDDSDSSERDEDQQDS